MSVDVITGKVCKLPTVGWQPQHLIVEADEEACALSQWATQLSARVARVRDIVEEELSARDFVAVPAPNPYAVGDHVVLRRPGRSQKRLPPFEPGWFVADVIAPSTVVIARRDNGQRQKVVNVDLLKEDLSDLADVVTESCTPAPDEQDAHDASGMDLPWGPAGDDAPIAAYNLRDRGNIRLPRYLLALRLCLGGGSSFAHVTR